jgi:hypothetical protein
MMMHFRPKVLLATIFGLALVLSPEAYAATKKGRGLGRFSPAAVKSAILKRLPWRKKQPAPKPLRPRAYRRSQNLVKNFSSKKWNRLASRLPEPETRVLGLETHVPIIPIMAVNEPHGSGGIAPYANDTDQQWLVVTSKGPMIMTGSWIKSEGKKNGRFGNQVTFKSIESFLGGYYYSKDMRESGFMAEMGKKAQAIYHEAAQKQARGEKFWETALVFNAWDHHID